MLSLGFYHVWVRVLGEKKKVTALAHIGVLAIRTIVIPCKLFKIAREKIITSFLLHSIYSNSLLTDFYQTSSG